MVNYPITMAGERQLIVPFQFQDFKSRYIVPVVPGTRITLGSLNELDGFVSQLGIWRFKHLLPGDYLEREANGNYPLPSKASDILRDLRPRGFYGSFTGIEATILESTPVYFAQAQRRSKMRPVDAVYFSVDADITSTGRGRVVSSHTLFNLFIKPKDGRFGCRRHVMLDSYTTNKEEINEAVEELLARVEAIIGERTYPFHVGDGIYEAY